MSYRHPKAYSCAAEDFIRFNISLCGHHRIVCGQGQWRALSHNYFTGQAFSDNDFLYKCNKAILYHFQSHLTLPSCVPYNKGGGYNKDYGFVGIKAGTSKNLISVQYRTTCTRSVVT